LGVVEPPGCCAKLKLNFGTAGGVLDSVGAAAGVWGLLFPNENEGAGAVAAVVEDDAGAALGAGLNPVKPNCVLGASVGLLAVALLEPPPNTLCVWVVVAPNGEGPEPVLFENADCVFALLPNGKDVALLPNAVGVVEAPNAEDAAEVAENADLMGSLFWFDGFPNVDEVVVLPNPEGVVVLLPKAEDVVVAGNDDLVGSLFWFTENPLKLNLVAAGVVLTVVDPTGAVVGVDVALELLEFNADAGVEGLKLKARGVL